MDSRNVACKTADCPEKDKIKKVRLQFLGQALYLDAPIICGGCGKRVRTV